MFFLHYVESTDKFTCLFRFKSCKLWQVVNKSGDFKNRDWPSPDIRKRSKQRADLIMEVRLKKIPVIDRELEVVYYFLTGCKTCSKFIFRMKCIMHLRSLNNGRKRVNIEKYGMRSFYNIGCEQIVFITYEKYLGLNLN